MFISGNIGEITLRAFLMLFTVYQEKIQLLLKLWSQSPKRLLEWRKDVALSSIAAEIWIMDSAEKQNSFCFPWFIFPVCSTLFISQIDLPAQWACTGDMCDRYLLECQQHSCWSWHYSLVNLMAFCYCFEVILLIFTVREGLLCCYVLSTTQGVEDLNKGVDMFSIQLILSRNRTAVNRLCFVAVLWQRKKPSLNSW